MEKDTVILKCPGCGRQHEVARHHTDLPGTAVVVATCPRCNDGDFESIDYFRADGSQILEG